MKITSLEAIYQTLNAELEMNPERHAAKSAFPVTTGIRAGRGADDDANTAGPSGGG